MKLCRGVRELSPAHREHVCVSSAPGASFDMSVRSIAGSLWMDPANDLLECSHSVHLSSRDKKESSHRYLRQMVSGLASSGPNAGLTRHK